MINGTIEHLLLGFVATLISLWWHRSHWPGVYVMLTVELVQADIYGWATLLSVDTLHDLGMDLIGLGIAFGLYSWFKIHEVKI